MKKLFLLFFILTICLSTTSCAEKAEQLSGKPILKVALTDDNNETGTKTEYYYVLDDEGNSEKTEAFTPDADSAFFYADVHSDFESKIINNGIVNKVIGLKGADKDGKAVSADKVTERIMQTAAKTIDHEMCEFIVINSKEQYFVFIKLNVNWQDPCSLYSYDENQDKLTHLYTWQSMDIVGISPENENKTI